MEPTTMPNAATELNTVFGRKLKDLLEKKNLQPKDLAAITGMHISLIYYYMNGRRVPSTQTIFRLAKALDMDPTKVFAMVDPGDFDVVASFH